jgi:hypothetical protein
MTKRGLYVLKMYWGYEKCVFLTESTSDMVSCTFGTKCLKCKSLSRYVQFKTTKKICFYSYQFYIILDYIHNFSRNL